MPLYCHKFSDLVLDWPMILVDRQGFANRRLSTEQVILYALEQIGYGTPKQDEVAALLVNTDPLDWQTIDRYLEEIGGKSYDRTIAVRKWRLAELKYLVDAACPSDASLEEDEEERYNVFFAISDFWAAYRDELLEGEEVLPEFGEPIPRMLSEQQVWIKCVEAALRGETGATS